MTRPAVDRDGVVEFARRLVRIKSVNRPGEGEAAAASAVTELACSWGWSPIVDQVAPGRPNVVIRVDGGEPGPTLMFEGHTDVVTEGDAGDWVHDPFGAEVEDGRIYGRGAADMKGGVSAMMHAVRAVEQAGPFPGSILIAVLCDEEEMMTGVSDFIARGHAAGVDGVIVCEPEGGEVCIVQKGALRLRVDFEGKMAHGAMPHQGRNPVAATAALVTATRELESRLQAEHGDHPHLGLPYVTPTHVAAGSLTQLNVIPGDARVTLDVRTIPGIDHDALVVAVKGMLERISTDLGVTGTVSVLVDRPPTATPPDDPVVRAVYEAHRDVTGTEPRYGGVPGTTDGTILWRDAGLPVVIYGPGDKWIAHQADEYVDIDDITVAAEVYAAAALRFLHG